MEFIVSILPVLLFLLSLFLFDSFKLVGKNTLIICLTWGVFAAVAAYFMNTGLSRHFISDHELLARYVAPLTEEVSKALIIFFLVYRKKIGFSIDAVIYGFAAGTGFALAENVFYLGNLSADTNMVVWLLRGFGTAIMHGGSTALIALLLMAGIQRDKAFILSVLPALAASYMLHSSYNHFLVNPLLQAVILLILLPSVFIIVFQKSNQLLQDWLEVEFSSEVEMLRMMRWGKFRDTKAGAYLASLKDYFNPETIVDLYAYITVFLELSITAKRNLMLRENDLDMIHEPDIEGKLIDLEQLRKQIGKAGELAIKPIVRMNHRELWKLSQLKK